jgi:16S rRNA (cytosine1407-C5)-methyltransferase
MNEIEKKFPERFRERITNLLPKNELQSFFENATKPLPKTIRVSNNFIQPQGWHLKKTAIANMFFIDRDDRQEIPLGRTDAHFCGEIYSQSLSSILPVKILDPQPGEKILDLCAAPGSKTTAIAEKLENSGVVVANEMSSSRAKKLAANIDRIGVNNVVIIQNDGIYLNTFFDQEFDKILVDAPCSSEAFGRRNSKFFEKMWHEKNIFAAAKIQKKILESAFKMCRPDGEIIYSTCTSAPEENEAVVQYLCSKFGDAVEILPISLPKNILFHKGISKWNDEHFDEKISKNVIRIWPHLKNELWDSEQFFCARIKKVKPLKDLPNKKTSPKKSPIKVFGKNAGAEIMTKIRKKFGIERSVFGKHNLLEKNGDIFMTTKLASAFSTKNPHRRAGMKIVDQEGNFTTEFAVKFGKEANKNIFEMTAEQKFKFLTGFDLFLENPLGIENSEQIFMKRLGRCFGIGKVQNDGKKIKNKLDRTWILR